jgi:hypothetical protein
MIAYAIGMSIHEALGVTCYKPPLAISLFGYLGFLPATAMAVTIRGIVRGIMGSHQKFSFWCHTAGHFAMSLRFFAFGFAPSLYHNGELIHT